MPIDAADQTIVINIEGRGPQGPPGSSVIDRSNPADLVSGAAQDVYTATATTVVTGFVVRATTVTTFASVPAFQFRRKSDGANFSAAVTAFGLDAAGKAYRITINGTFPVLASGDVVEIVKTTTAGAAVFAVSIDLEGYVLA